jgi:hypothetical protein
MEIVARRGFCRESVGICGVVRFDGVEKRFGDGNAGVNFSPIFPAGRSCRVGLLMKKKPVSETLLLAMPGGSYIDLSRTERRGA